MPKAKWIITTNDSENPVPGNKTAVYTEAELKKLLKAAKDAGVEVTVRDAE